jgi:hypothetical protein
LVARENNNSITSNESEYFITDIEFDSGLGARFDMLAIYWPANKRKSGNNCQVALIEMKYGDNALGGAAGLIEHLRDIDEFISSEKYQFLLETMEAQFNQIDQLELLKFNRSSNVTKIKLDAKNPQVIFLLANHNPRSLQLKTMLEEPEFIKLSQSQHFDLKFFVASFAGYGLHADCMLPMDKFQKLL